MLLVLLALLVGLSCQWNELASSDAKLRAQADVSGDIHGDSHNNSRSTPATTSLRITETGFTEADFERHVKELNAELKKKLSVREAQGFSIVIQKPFVVIGNESKEVVQQRAQDTVKWAVDRLKQDFFTKDPDDILDIWLFKDEASYEKHARLLFGDTPSTP